MVNYHCPVANGVDVCRGVVDVCRILESASLFLCLQLQMTRPYRDRTVCRVRQLRCDDDERRNENECVCWFWLFVCPCVVLVLCWGPSVCDPRNCFDLVSELPAGHVLNSVCKYLQADFCVFSSRCRAGTEIELQSAKYLQPLATGRHAGDLVCTCKPCFSADFTCEFWFPDSIVVCGFASGFVTRAIRHCRKHPADAAPLRSLLANSKSTETPVQFLVLRR